MVPTIGRVVLYNTTEEQRKKMEDSTECNVQEQLPAIVVAVWGTTDDSLVNLNVQYDGVGSFWVTSAPRGDGEGEWNWPPRV